MRKVLLYFYPTEEEIKGTFDQSVEFHSSKKYKESFPKTVELLNHTVDVRYRQKGYEVIYVLDEGTRLYGLRQDENDKVIYFNSPWRHIRGRDAFYDYYELFKQIGDVDNLVVTGYRSEGDVKSAAKYAYDDLNIDTLIDPDLTERFFDLLDASLYGQTYFQEENYDPKRYKRMVCHIFDEEDGHRDVKETFQKCYGHPVYGFYGRKKNQ